MTQTPPHHQFYGKGLGHPGPQRYFTFLNELPQRQSLVTKAMGLAGNLSESHFLYLLNGGNT